MTTALPWCFSPSVQVLWRGGLQRLEQKPVPRLQCPRAPGLWGALHLLHPEHGNCVGVGCGLTQFAKHCSPSAQVEQALGSEQKVVARAVLSLAQGPWQGGAVWAASSESEHLSSVCMCGPGPGSLVVVTWFLQQLWGPCLGYCCFGNLGRLS